MFESFMFLFSLNIQWIRFHLFISYWTFLLIFFYFGICSVKPLPNIRQINEGCKSQAWTIQVSLNWQIKCIANRIFYQFANLFVFFDFVENTNVTDEIKALNVLKINFMVAEASAESSHAFWCGWWLFFFCITVTIENKFESFAFYLKNKLLFD